MRGVVLLRLLDALLLPVALQLLAFEQRIVRLGVLPRKEWSKHAAEGERKGATAGASAGQRAGEGIKACSVHGASPSVSDADDRGASYTGHVIALWARNAPVSNTTVCETGAGDPGFT